MIRSRAWFIWMMTIPRLWSEVFFAQNGENGFMVRVQTPGGIETYYDFVTDDFVSGDWLLALAVGDGQVEVEQVHIFEFDGIDLPPGANLGGNAPISEEETLSSPIIGMEFSRRSIFRISTQTWENNIPTVPWAGSAFGVKLKMRRGIMIWHMASEKGKWFL